VLVRKDDTAIKSFDDLKGKKSCRPAGHYRRHAVPRRVPKVPRSATFNTNDLACIELKNKSVDAVIGDLPVEQYFLKNGGR
jgi:glutamine transport system substrate-binding protein